MNRAEQKRDARIAWLDDVELLEKVLAEEEVTGEARVAFAKRAAEIRSGARRCLSKRERAWAEDTLKKYMPIRAADVPKGRPVETPAVLQNLPKKPPQRRRVDDGD